VLRIEQQRQRLADVLQAPDLDRGAFRVALRRQTLF
jgi:hypothetical protein